MPMHLLLASSRGRSNALQAAVVLTLFCSGAVAQAETCRAVNGHYSEQAVDPTSCASPVHLCLAGSVSGPLRGDYLTVVSRLDPTADTSTTAVVLFTGDTIVRAQLGARRGNLYVKNAGAIHNTGRGEIIDLQTIVSGTGDLIGATGVLKATGFFSNGAGESEYVGTICLP